MVLLSALRANYLAYQSDLLHLHHLQHPLASGVECQHQLQNKITTDLVTFESIQRGGSDYRRDIGYQLGYGEQFEAAHPEGGPDKDWFNHVEEQQQQQVATYGVTSDCNVPLGWMSAELTTAAPRQQLYCLRCRQRDSAWFCDRCGKGFCELCSGAELI